MSERAFAVVCAGDDRPQGAMGARRRVVRQLPPTGAVIVAAPLKIQNGSGSPLRVLALVPGQG